MLDDDRDLESSEDHIEDHIRNIATAHTGAAFYEFFALLGNKIGVIDPLTQQAVA